MNGSPSAHYYYDYILPLLNQACLIHAWLDLMTISLLSSFPLFFLILTLSLSQSNYSIFLEEMLE